MDESAAMPSVVVAYKLNSALNQPKVDLTTLPGGRDSVKDVKVTDVRPSLTEMANLMLTMVFRIS